MATFQAQNCALVTVIGHCQLPAHDVKQETLRYLFKWIYFNFQGLRKKFPSDIRVAYSIFCLISPIFYISFPLKGPFLVLDSLVSFFKEFTPSLSNTTVISGSNIYECQWSLVLNILLLYFYS